MTKWKIDKVLGLSVGAGLMVAIALVDVGAIWLATVRPLGIGTFIIGLAGLCSLGLLGLIGYWLYGLASSGYTLDRNALVIHWGPMEQVIPMGEIETAFVGDDVEGRIQFYGGIWPGHCAGYGEIPDVGPTLFYGTAPPQHQVYIVTPSLAYGISPADQESFLASLHERLQMGPTQFVEQSSKRPGLLDWAIWRDWLGLGMLAAGSLIFLALLGLLCFRFPVLPRLMPLHFDVTGNPDRLGSRSQIFTIPLIGLLALLLNGVLGGLSYRRERVVSYLLWGGAILVQVLVWAAAIGILGQVG